MGVPYIGWEGKFEGKTFVYCILLAFSLKIIENFYQFKVSFSKGDLNFNQYVQLFFKNLKTAPGQRKTSPKIFSSFGSAVLEKSVDKQTNSVTDILLLYGKN